MLDGGVGADDIDCGLLGTGGVVLVQQLGRALEGYRDALRGQGRLLPAVPELVVLPIKADEDHLLLPTRPARLSGQDIQYIKLTVSPGARLSGFDVYAKIPLRCFMGV